MKIYLNGWIHHKNLSGIQMMNGRGIDFFPNGDDSLEFDYLMLTDSFNIPNIKYKKGIIFGPHISLEKLGEHPGIADCVFNSLSPWLVDLSKKIFPQNKYVNLPFPIDTERFFPREKKGPPVLYFKRRDQNLLNDFLKENGNINFKIYDYERGYQENDFLTSISEAPYAVWIGCHESQGFALGETLSCDTPIFVIDSLSLRDEIGGGWGNRFPDSEHLSCTSASYFDLRCGIKSNKYEYDKEFPIFLNMVKDFSPRNFIIETLSTEQCIKKWIEELK